MIGVDESIRDDISERGSLFSKIASQGPEPKFDPTVQQMLLGSGHISRIR